MPADFGWRGAVAPSPCARADPPENPTRTRRANPTRGRVSRSPVAGQSPLARAPYRAGSTAKRLPEADDGLTRGGHDARRASSQPQRSRLRDHRGYFLVVLGIGAAHAPARRARRPAVGHVACRRDGACPGAVPPGQRGLTPERVTSPYAPCGTAKSRLWADDNPEPAVEHSPRATTQVPSMRNPAIRRDAVRLPSPLRRV